MSGTVYKPRDVKCERVPQHNAREERVPKTFAPQVVRNVCGNQSPNECHEWYVEPALESDQWVLFEVTHVDSLSLLDDVRVFSAQKPTDVREEEPALSVVRVGVGLRVLVVHAMVATPLEDVVLEGQNMHKR